MGEFLSTPNKNKVSEDNDGTTVTHNNIRSDMELQECKDGEREWKTHTSPILT